jgi:hypothetical protein
MIKLIFLTLLSLLIFGNTSSKTKEETVTEKFNVSVLSVSGQEAFKNLNKAMQFEDTHVGIAGSLSEHVVEFGFLIKEKNAASAFKAILKNGTEAGKLYALSGIYFTDYKFFKKAVDKYKKNNNIVMKISGCIVSDEKISNIVESKAKNVAIIKPTQTLEDFLKSNSQSYSIDIANGGYSATFKHFAEKKE